MATAPASWPLRIRLAEAYIDVGQPKRTVEVLEESLARTEGPKMPDQTRQLLELANQKLDELELWLLTPVQHGGLSASSSRLPIGRRLVQLARPRYGNESHYCGR